MAVVCAVVFVYCCAGGSQNMAKGIGIDSRAVGNRAWVIIGRFGDKAAAEEDKATAERT